MAEFGWSNGAPGYGAHGPGSYADLLLDPDGDTVGALSPRRGPGISGRVFTEGVSRPLVALSHKVGRARAAP